MIWLLLLSLVFLAAGIAQVRFSGRLQSLGRVARQLAAGEPAKGFVGYDNSALGQLSWQLQKIDATLTSLREEMAEREIAHRAVLSNLVEGVMVVDRGRIIRLANGDCPALFGSGTAPHGTNGLRFLCDPSIEKIVTSVLDSGKTESREIEFSHRLGGMRHFEMVGRPLHGMNGGITAVVLAFHDISQMRKLEQGEHKPDVMEKLPVSLWISSGHSENPVHDAVVPRQQQAGVFESEAIGMLS